MLTKISPCRPFVNVSKSEKSQNLGYVFQRPGASPSACLCAAKNGRPAQAIPSTRAGLYIIFFIQYRQHINKQQQKHAANTNRDIFFVKCVFPSFPRFFPICPIKAAICPLKNRRQHRSFPCFFPYLPHLPH